MLFNVEHLPVEILEHIFDYLCVADRLVASLVCRQWLLTISQQKLLKDICIVFRCNAEETVQTFANVTRRFCCVSFKYTRIGKNSLLFLKTIKSQLIFLAFEKCEFECDFGVIIDKCVNLKVLYVNDCGRLDKPTDDPLYVSLPNLVDFKLSSNCIMSDSLFWKLCSEMPNLEKLSLVMCQISFHKASYKRFYPSGFKFPEENSFSTLLFSYPVIEYLIKDRCMTITSLDFSRTSITSSALLTLAKIDGLKLQNISLAACEECIVHLDELALHQNSLLSADLSMLYSLSDDMVLKFCHNLPNIEELNLECCCKISELSARFIFQLKKLKELNLSQCRTITSLGFENAVCHSKCNLKSLNLGHCSITDTFITNLCGIHQNLTNLDISFSDVTDLSVHSISRNLLFLRTLKLSFCTKISDNGLLGITLNNTDQNPDQNLADVATLVKNSSVGISNIKGLKQLDLSGCDKISDFGVISSVRLIELQVLNLSYTSITDNVIESLGKYNPSLEVLILKGCCLLTDEGIKQIILNFRRLSHLDLQECNKLTDQTINIISRCSHQLKFLNVIYCNNLTPEALVSLRSLNPMLTTHS